MRNERRALTRGGEAKVPGIAAGAGAAVGTVALYARLLLQRARA